MAKMKGFLLFPANVMVHISTLSWILFCSHMVVKASMIQGGRPSNSTQASTLIQRIRTGELITICRPKPVGESPEVKPQPEISSMSYGTILTASHYKRKHSGHHNWILLDQGTSAPIKYQNQEDSVEISGSYHKRHPDGKNDKSKEHHHDKGSKNKGDKSSENHNKGLKIKKDKSTGHHHKKSSKEKEEKLTEHDHDKGSKEKGKKSKENDHEKGSKEKKGKSTVHHNKGLKGQKDKSTGHHHKKNLKENSGKKAWHIHEKRSKDVEGKNTGHHKSKGSKDKSNKSTGHYHKINLNDKKTSKGEGGNKNKNKKEHQIKTSNGFPGKSHGHHHVKYPKSHGGKSKSPKGKGGKSKSLKWSPKGNGGKSKGSKGSSKGKGGKSKGSKGITKGKGGKSKGSKGSPKVKDGKSKGSKGGPKVKGKKLKGSKGSPKVRDEKSKRHFWFHIQQEKSVKGDVVSCGSGSVPCHNSPILVVSGQEVSPGSNEGSSSSYEPPMKSSSLDYTYGYKDVVSSNKREKLSFGSVADKNDETSIAKGRPLSHDYGSNNIRNKNKANGSYQGADTSSISFIKGSSLDYNYGYKSASSSKNKEKSSVTSAAKTDDVTNIAKGSPLSLDNGSNIIRNKNKANGIYQDTDTTKSSMKESSLSYNNGYKSAASSKNNNAASVKGGSSANISITINKGGSLSYNYGGNKGHSNKKDSKVADTTDRSDSFSDFMMGSSLDFNYGYKSASSSKNKEKSSVTSVANTDDATSIAKGSSLSLDNGSNIIRNKSKANSSYQDTDTTISSMKESSFSFNYGSKSSASSKNNKAASVKGGSSANVLLTIEKGGSLSYNYGGNKGHSIKKDSKVADTTDRSDSFSDFMMGSSLDYTFGYKSAGSSKNEEKSSVTSVANTDDATSIAKGSPLSHDNGINIIRKKSKANSSYQDKDTTISSMKESSLSYNYGYKSAASSQNNKAASVEGGSSANVLLTIEKGGTLSYNYSSNKGHSNNKESKVAGTTDRSDAFNDFHSKRGSSSYKYGRRREKATKKFVHLTDANDYISSSSRAGGFLSAFGTDFVGLHNRKRALSKKTSNDNYCSGDSLPIEIICKNSSQTTDFELSMLYKVEVTSSVPYINDLAKVEAGMLSSAAQVISCLQNCGCTVVGVSSSSSPIVKHGCNSYEGSNYCFEVKDTMAIHLVHIDGVPIEKVHIDEAVNKITSTVTADAKEGTYNYGSIINVKVLSSFADDTFTYRNEVESVPITIPRSSEEGLTSAKEARSSTGFIVGLLLICVGLIAVFFFALLKKKSKKGERELNDLAQAYYEEDDQFSKLGPWDVLSLSSDGKTLTSSVIDPSLNPAETSKNVHICSSAMCTECSTRKNRSQRVQFIPCVDEKRSETNQDEEEKSF